MRKQVYAKYNEKFVKNTILFADSDNYLYFDSAKTSESLVNKVQLKDLFEKGCIVDDGSKLYQPIALVRNTTTNENNVIGYDGTNTVTFSSEDNEIYPLVPTYTKNTRVISIPTQTGVDYFKDDGTTPLTAGDQTPIAAGVVSVKITAAPEEGYKFDPESVTEWVFDTTIEVQPTAPTFDDQTGVITITATTGCTYKMDGSVVEAGAQSPIPKDTDVVVTVEPNTGYVIKSGSTVEWTFKWND